jgi:hypothetical protein
MMGIQASIREAIMKAVFIDLGEYCDDLDFCAG